MGSQKTNWKELGRTRCGSAHPKDRATYTAEPPGASGASGVSGASGAGSSGLSRDWNFSSCSGLASVFRRVFSRSSWEFFSTSSRICSFRISTSSFTYFYFLLPQSHPYLGSFPYERLFACPACPQPRPFLTCLHNQGPLVDYFSSTAGFRISYLRALGQAVHSALCWASVRHSSFLCSLGSWQRGRLHTASLAHLPQPSTLP